MNRIFLTLSIAANFALAAAVWYGLGVHDESRDLQAVKHAVSMHLLVALGASLLVLMLHAVVLTYFMGTGRWLEDTTTAYRLDERFRQRNIRLKYKAIPGMVLCMLLVIVTGAFGASADPLPTAASTMTSTIHFTLAMALVGLNLLVSGLEYAAISQNGRLVAEVVGEVRRIRKERGLDA
ncbi:hypothetical protein Pan44_20300 [Caulifigura coniformis]|uniref:Cytochrome b561 bacterial/Ni-hydrogenase domain-containing protein n=1 Tax=Caulifigura coniformis TaxID=2527983 RepID=A0A517SD07_9PLAN|nr:hypothetical protein [Caulifigura coniformis]QDT54003.1 hypothetical protein Pan44_20300 [Caulifigura coniformis]